ncbi:hypothetical protein EV360DRAFT_76302 [Lentinula raphanica]|nr:hypothetical protein EV360DRAFT_76302 [Lentinula raphanica]
MQVGFKSLPNEILETIIHDIAYIPNSNSSSWFKFSTNELRVLSVVNWRLRHLCLPFLFANIKVTDAEKLEKDLAFLSKFTRTMIISPLTAVNETEDQLLARFLPQFKHLSHVQLRDESFGRTASLRKVLAQPAITSVLVEKLPDQSMCNDDLSKVILEWIDHFKAFSPWLQPYLNRGMRVNSLEIFELGDLDEVASRSVFPILSGLREIQMHMRNKPVPSLFLSKLLSTHSTFNELWLRLYPQLSYVHDTPAFISSFVQESQRQSFIEFFAFKHVGFRRDFIGQSSHEWYVMDLTLDTIPANTSLVEMLARLASSFPKLEKLTLDLNRHQGSYPINDLAPVFGHFSKSLGTLYLLGVNLRLEYRNTEFPPLIRTAGPTNADDAMLTRVETGLLWFASWVARETRNLNYIFTTDTVLRSGSQLRHGESWCILGSFPVKSGNRDIVGSIQRTIGARRLVSEAEIGQTFSVRTNSTVHSHSDVPSSQSRVRCASPELLSLSVADWRLRRICLPFLFANISIRCVKHVQKLANDSALLSRFTKIVVISYSYDALTQAGDQLLCHLLPQLEKLLQVELRHGVCRTNRTALLRAILARPNVTSVLIHDLPDESMCNIDDLSKVILDRESSATVFSPAFTKYMDRGMRLGCLDIRESDSFAFLDENVSSKLKEIQIVIPWAVPRSYSFLSALSSIHSTLEELWLLDDFGVYLHDHTPPFLSSSFIEKSRQQNLNQSFSITRIGARRAQAVGQSGSSQECSVIEVLDLVASSFLNLEHLVLDFRGDEGTYHVNDLAKVFRQFSSLRTLCLNRVYQRLLFENDDFWSPEEEPADPRVIQSGRTEAGLSLLTSCVAKEGRSLDTIYVSNEREDLGEGDGEDDSSEFTVSACFHVVNSDRDIAGKWDGFLDMMGRLLPIRYRS